jgi:uncharacterized membrane protein
LVDEVARMLTNEYEDAGSDISNKTLWLLFLGIILVLVGLFVIFIASMTFGGSGSIGGVILIGPFPIVFGAGPESVFLITVGIVITIVSFVLFWVFNKRIKRKND